MSVTIDLSSDEERRLRDRAAQRGQDLATYVLSLIRDDLDTTRPPREGATFGEILAAVHTGTRESGLSDTELDSIIDTAIQESRAERNGASQIPK